MDLRNLMNDDEKGQSKKEGQHTSASAPAPPNTNAQPTTPSHYGHTSQQQTPLYAPPSASGIPRPPLQSQGMTPLRTPSHNAPSAQYPFPQQAQQSPISAVPGQHYRPFESQPLTHPVRPGSHGQQHQTSQPASYSSQTPLQQHNSYTSISPTPPSHLSRTPSSMRQSPLATLSHLPSQQQQQQHYSQPNTPLGPPQHYPQRAPTYPETHSPYHQRSFSNASNGLVSGSPAQHHPGIPNLVESPNAYARPSPQTAHSRRPSEYLSQNQSQRGSRERSISVSPKTKPPPRIPSLGSRQSSNPQEIYSARTSEQYNTNAPLAGSPNHVTHQPIPQPQSQSQSQQPRFGTFPNPASEVSHATPSLQPAPSMFPPGAQSSLSSQSGNQTSQPQPPSNNISHQSEKMGMSHLVTPASEVPPQVNGNMNSRPPPSTTGSQSAVNMFTKKEKAASPPPSISRAQDTHMEGTGNGNSISPASTMDGQTKASLKRPASSSDSLGEPAPKQQKTSRKYTERPTWARLSKHNPKFAQQGAVAADRPVNGRQAPTRTNGNRPAQNGAAVQHPSNLSGDQAIDTDMMRIRNLLGDWERSFKNVQPLPDTQRQVADWMFTELARLRDVGTDPHYGTVEIEGKIGTLFHKDTGDRCVLPVMNTVILNSSLSEQYRFESRMQESEHSHMNETLNAALRKSLDAPNRVKMRYKHFTDVDSFKPLSPSGLQALPAAIRKRVEHGRAPRLRTTVRHEKGRSPFVAARIVKVNTANLHVYSPNDPYDLRISINVEVNLDRPDLHPDDLVTTSSDPQGEALPDRRKDRISYNHLAYQVDLTRVDVVAAGERGPSKQRPLYELEIEVDASLLRAQMRIAEEGRESAFGDVIGGFWDNAILLMRERPAVAR